MPRMHLQYWFTTSQQRSDDGLIASSIWPRFATSYRTHFASGRIFIFVYFRRNRVFEINGTVSVTTNLIPVLDSLEA